MIMNNTTTNIYIYIYIYIYIVFGYFNNLYIQMLQKKASLLKKWTTVIVLIIEINMWINIT